MTAPKKDHRRLTRLATVVTAVAALTIPHAVQAAPKPDAGGSKGKPPPRSTSSTTDLATTVTDLADPVLFGGQVTYRTVVRNVGQTTVDDVHTSLQVHGDYRGKVIYSSVTTTKGSCPMHRYGTGSDLPLPGHDGISVTVGIPWGEDIATVEHYIGPHCTIGTLDPGETATMDVVALPTYPSRYDSYSAEERPTLYAFASGWHPLDSQDGNSENDWDWERTSVTTGTDAGDCVATAVAPWNTRPPCLKVG